MSPEKAIIFIDGSNFYNGAKRNGLPARIDFFKISKEITSGYNLIRTYYYGAPLIQAYDPEGYKSQQRFFDALKRTPSVELRLGRLERRNSTYVERGTQ